MLISRLGAQQSIKICLLILWLAAGRHWLGRDLTLDFFQFHRQQIKNSYKLAFLKPCDLTKFRDCTRNKCIRGKRESVAANIKKAYFFLSNIIKLIDYLEFGMDRKENEVRNDKEQEIGLDIEENVNSGHKPFLSRLYSKTTPIGFEYHQVIVPAWTGPVPSRAEIKQQVNKRDISMRPQTTFLASRIKADELEDYLAFAQSYYQQKIPDYFTVGTVSRERTRAKAMDFLHKMDYNYVKAKFYILFPYYLTYNIYRCHDPLSISIQDMEKKINDHLEGLKNTKEKDMEKWIETLESCLSSRMKFQSFIALIEQGKQNKYQIPEHIKQHIQKSQKIGKQLRKSLQGTKLSIESLRAKKQMLDQYKLQTSDMVSFEDSVNRCEQWIKKQKLFQSKYFRIEDKEYHLENPGQKIQFRQIQLLVNEYTNLPLLCPQFESTTKVLYQKTMQLLQNIPNTSKIVKTRNAKQVTITKIPYKQMKDYMKLIQSHPVCHEQFSSFEVNMRESMELIERMNMYLEDPLSQKNSKTLNNYIKLMGDVQIQNNVEKRLRNRQQCNDIIEKIKKQISNPGKVQSIKEAFNRLREKGIKQMEDLVYQQKILMYIGWHESQERLNESKVPLTNIDIIAKELYLREKLVNVEEYKSQLQSAKKQWSISEQLIQQAYARLEKNSVQQQIITDLLADPNPNLSKMIEVLRECIAVGLTFPELWSLHDQIVRYFIDLAKIHSLLKFRPENLDQQTQKKFFFTPEQADMIISMIVYPEQMKLLRTKQKAEQLLIQIREAPFPRYMEQCKAFEQFMKKGEQWAERVRELIRNFTEEGDSIDIKQLEDSRYFIHSKAIKEQIGKIQSIMRWRQKIAKKLEDGRPMLFSQEQQQFLLQLEKDLNNYQTLASPTSFKQLFLQYSKDNDSKIKKILNLIVYESRIQNICKLSQMNKFHRQIEKQNQRHKIEDKKILQLKDKFKDEIVAADDWKERYLMIKRFEKKKMLKRQDNQVQLVNQDLNGIPDQNIKQNQNLENGNQMSPEHPSIQYRKKYTVKNGEFTWYFKFLIMILQFSKGYKLKFCLEELSKLKNSLVQIEKFINHYDRLFEKPEPYDSELTNLDIEASKIQIFIREIWMLKKKNAYVNSWRIIVDAILDSVPIVSMQLKARKPEQLLTVLANKKMETEEAKKQISEQRIVQPSSLKRQRKPNRLYNTSEITLYADENLSSKPKKKKKGNNTNGDGQYRNTAVSSLARKNTRNELEQIERTEAIIKAGVQSGALQQDPKQYCICRYGEPNENTTMVQCQEKCQEWYHIQCIGIKKHQAKGDNQYVCVGCSSLYNLKSQGAFYWDYRSKISEYALEQIISEGKKLGVFTQQLKKINIVYDKMVGWKRNVHEVLTNIIRDDFLGKQISSYKDKLYELYLLSLWLPTFHYESSTIKRLLLVSRNQKPDQLPL